MNEKPVYVMITDWNNYWNKRESASYTKSLVKFDLQSHQLVENAPTLFIEVKKENYEIEKAWFGRVRNFRKEKKKIRFDVQKEEEVDLNEALDIIKGIDAIPQPKSNPEPGWYLASQIKSSIIVPEEVALYPPFFYNLIKTKDPSEFEDLVFQLLKLIGINNICKIDRKRQAGMEDGFFVFRNLAVIYDCTLKTDLTDKEEQINNYCRRLDDVVELSCKSKGKPFNIKNKNKQVWIITRNKTQTIKEYPGDNGESILVKEISINDLIEIYIKRMKENLFEEELERILEDLGIKEF
ncbi:MAG: hypothetical protein ACO2OT_03735 [Candidatus Caldipriscus sp.]|jgi:hypothetical protein